MRKNLFFTNDRIINFTRILASYNNLSEKPMTLVTIASKGLKTNLNKLEQVQFVKLFNSELLSEMRTHKGNTNLLYFCLASYIYSTNDFQLLDKLITDDDRIMVALATMVALKFEYNEEFVIQNMFKSFDKTDFEQDIIMLMLVNCLANLQSEKAIRSLNANFYKKRVSSTMTGLLLNSIFTNESGRNGFIDNHKEYENLVFTILITQYGTSKDDIATIALFLTNKQFTGDSQFNKKLFKVINETRENVRLKLSNHFQRLYKIYK